MNPTNKSNKDYSIGGMMHQWDTLHEVEGIKVEESRIEHTIMVSLTDIPFQLQTTGEGITRIIFSLRTWAELHKAVSPAEKFLFMNDKELESFAHDWVIARVDEGEERITDILIAGAIGLPNDVQYAQALAYFKAIRDKHSNFDA